MGRIVEAAFPRRMGTDYRWYLGSAWATNLGDGLALAAGPLLVASQTRDPQLIALGTGLQWLPFVVFGLPAGVVADRVNRTRIIAVANLCRVAILALLALAIAGEQINVGLVLVALFTLGTAETFVDSTATTLLPMLVDDGDIGIGNARLIFGQITINRLIGPPLGALLFAVAMWLPFAGQAVTAAIGVVMILRIRSSTRPAERHDVPVEPASLRRVRSEIAEGLAWLWRHPPMRTLTLLIVAFNVTFGAAISVLVLLAFERLGLDEIGFGLLTAVGALGGIVGSAAYGWLERHLTMANMMRIGLTIETFTHLGLAVSTTAWISMAIFFVFGAHEAVWGTVSSTVRHRAVPREFQGRVASVYLVGVRGGLVVGAALGGVIAARWGVTGPFWYAFVGSAILLAVMWPQLDNIAHAGEPTTTKPTRVQA